MVERAAARRTRSASDPIEVYDAERREVGLDERAGMGPLRHGPPRPSSGSGSAALWGWGDVPEHARLVAANERAATSRRTSRHPALSGRTPRAGGPSPHSAVKQLDPPAEERRERVPRPLRHQGSAPCCPPRPMTDEVEMRLPWISAGVLTAGAVTACVVAAPSPGVAATPNLITSKQVISVNCVPSGGLSRASVRTKMTVVNYHGITGRDWADHMQVKARIEKDGPGFQLSRNWASAKSEYSARTSATSSTRC